MKPAVLFAAAQRAVKLVSLSRNIESKRHDVPVQPSRVKKLHQHEEARITEVKLWQWCDDWYVSEMI